MDKELYQKLILQGVTDQETAPDIYLPGYEVIRRLGRGGMSSVYLARETTLDRLVAIKILHPEKSDTLLRERFRREALMLASINHPNVVAIHSVTENEDNDTCLVLEYVSGGDVRDKIAKHEKLTEPQATQIAIDVCNGLEVLHAESIVHRDINPLNVLLTEEGVAKVSDLGIALSKVSGTHYPDLTETGFIIGTRAYLAPEQLKASNDDIDARADIWAVGVLIYEMLVGTPPAAMMVSDVLAELPASIRPIVKKCLRQKAQDRYQSASELRTALVRAAKPHRNKLWLGIPLAAMSVATVSWAIFTNFPQNSTTVEQHTVEQSKQVPKNPLKIIPSQDESPPPIDIISTLSTPLTATRGLWAVKNGVLTCQKYEAGACIEFPVQNLGHDYDFSLTLTRHTGTHSTTLFLPTASGNVNLDIDAWSRGLAGIQDINATNLRRHQESFVFRLQRNQPYFVEVKVRQKSISISIDNQHLYTWDIEGRALSHTRYWEAPIRLGVGAWKSEFSFKHITLKKIKTD